MEIYKGLAAHLKKEKASFHMPGHKNGAAYFGSPLFSDILKLDTTELFGTDCLYHPTEMIKSAQENAATAFGADRAYFLVNGSTGGILSMFYSAFCEGDKVIVDRNCHKSAISAMVLSGVHPIYITPEENEELLTSGKISPEKVELLFNQHEGIKGVYITSPNYYGICSDLEKIADIAHKNNAVLLVDEAHGAHFPFSSAFPKNASRCGADLSVCSLHKSLAAPNQSALLCAKGERIDFARLENAILTFTTTSPSYILLAYSDAAICLAQRHGEEYTNKLFGNIADIPALKTDDPFKIILSYKDNGVSGEEAEQILREKFGIYAELSDHANVLLMASWANTDKDFALLKEACSYLSGIKSTSYKKITYPALSQEISELSPRQTEKAAREYVLPKDASGRISAGTVTTFPPCIPVILPGELISKAQSDFLQNYRGKTVGVFEGRIPVIK